MVLFGVRSPIAVDYEISAERIGNPFKAGVSLGNSPRVLSSLEIFDIRDVRLIGDAEAMPCAFSPQRRRQLASTAEQHGLNLADALVDPTAILPPKFKIGAGSYVNVAVVVGGGTFVGTGVLINRSASIGHHCILEDWASIGPGAIISGNVRIGMGSMIGAGAIIQTDIRIGKNVKVSAGAVVRKHVPDGAIVAGNPARIVTTRQVPSSLDQAGQE